MATLQDYATLQNLEDFWKPIIDIAERNRAETLLHMASNYLRQIAKNNEVDLDEKITPENDPDGVYAEAIQLVILEVVKRALQMPIDAPPAEHWSQTATPYSETMRFSSPSSDLFFKKSELQILGLSSLSGETKFGLLEGVR